MSKERFLTVHGKRFHFIWLRDNCRCSECRHPTSFQKMVDISKQATHPEPLSVEEQDDYLKIVWDEDPSHESIFPTDWLLSFAYDNVTDNVDDELLLWDKAWIEDHPPTYYAAGSSASITEPYFDQLFTLGFTILEGMTADEMEPFLTSIGAIYNTDYGLFYGIKSRENANDLADTGFSLSFHTDYTYWQTPALLSSLYCVENDAIGGESVIIDAFRIASDFRQNHPDYFDILVQTPIQFRQFYTDLEYDYACTQPIIELGEQGQLRRINFAQSHHYNWSLPFDQMEPFYAAYLEFMRYLRDPVYQFTFRLRAGDCLLMNNMRVMHARNPYQGDRHVIVGCIAWDYITGRQNFQRTKHLYLDM